MQSTQEAPAASFSSRLQEQQLADDLQVHQFGCRNSFCTAQPAEFFPFGLTQTASAILESHARSTSTSSSTDSEARDHGLPKFLGLQHI